MRIILACLALLIGSPALSLSCLRPDAVRLFEQARNAEEAFYIVKGDIQVLEAPNIPEPGTKTPALTRAKVTGQALSASGFNAAFDREVLLETTCLASWCGAPGKLSGTLLMAIEVGPDTLTLHIGPCGGDQMRWDQGAEDRLLKCHLDGMCERAEF